MDNDDQIIGRILSRREILALLGSGGAMLLVGCSDNASSPKTTATTSGGGPSGAGSNTSPTAASSATPLAAASTTAVSPQCVVSPALTEGPYFVDEKLNRSDIRTDTRTGKVSEGTQLLLTFVVGAASSNQCAPLANALVDIWHCDALGAYSDATDRSFNTKGQDFLRGQQLTGTDGAARFTTVFPGWYDGRAVHIHFKIRGTKANGQAYDFTSQIFFSDAQADEVYAASPYASRGKPTLRNAGDGIYNQSGGQTLVKLTKSGNAYAGGFSVGLQGV